MATTFKILMVLLVIVYAAIILAKMPDEEALEQRLKEIRKNCIKDFNLTKEQAKAIYRHKLFTNDTTLADTPKEVQCYCYCYLKEFNIFTNDTPNEKFLRETLPPLINDKKKADDVLDKCLKLEGKDMCEVGFNFDLCLMKETSLHVY